MNEENKRCCYQNRKPELTPEEKKLASKLSFYGNIFWCTGIILGLVGLGNQIVELWLLGWIPAFVGFICLNDHMDMVDPNRETYIMDWDEY